MHAMHFAILRQQEQLYFIKLWQVTSPFQCKMSCTRSNDLKFIQIKANKNCYKYSFIPRTLVDWNSLPPQITTIQDKAKLKSAVLKIYSSGKI